MDVVRNVCRILAWQLEGKIQFCRHKMAVGKESGDVRIWTEFICLTLVISAGLL
jgi:hypothetical protein